MGTIEELNRIQNETAVMAAAEKKKAQKKAIREANKQRKNDIARADSDLLKHLEEIKNDARKEPYNKETRIYFGVVSEDYADRVVKNLKKEGFKIVLKQKYHEEQHYGDEGWHGSYTSYEAKVSWK